MRLRTAAVALLLAAAACDSSAPGPPPASVAGRWVGSAPTTADATLQRQSHDGDVETLRCTGDVVTSYAFSLNDDGGTVTGTLRMTKTGELTLSYDDGTVEVTRVDGETTGSVAGTYDPPFLDLQSTSPLPATVFRLRLGEGRAHLLTTPWGAGVPVSWPGYGGLRCTPSETVEVVLERTG